jgi:hypothetical protein
MSDTVDTIMGGILDPTNAFNYTKISNREFEYYDSVGNIFCLRLIKIEPKKFEIELSWVDENGGHIIEPAFPASVVTGDNNKRGNTVSKIFIEEILPFAKKINAELSVKPFEANRYSFCKRVLEKFVSEEFSLIEVNQEFTITIK